MEVELPPNPVRAGPSHRVLSDLRLAETSARLGADGKKRYERKLLKWIVRKLKADSSLTWGSWTC